MSGKLAGKPGCARGSSNKRQNASKRELRKKDEIEKKVSRKRYEIEN